MQSREISKHSLTKRLLSSCLILNMDQKKGVVPPKFRFGQQINFMPLPRSDIRENLFVEKFDALSIQIPSQFWEKQIEKLGKEGRQ